MHVCIKLLMQATSVASFIIEAVLANTDEDITEVIMKEQVAPYLAGEVNWQLLEGTKQAAIDPETTVPILRE